MWNASDVSCESVSIRFFLLTGKRYEDVSTKYDDFSTVGIRFKMEWLLSIGCGRDSAGAEMVTFGKSSIDQIRMILGNEDLVRARVVGFVMVFISSLSERNIFFKKNIGFLPLEF